MPKKSKPTQKDFMQLAVDIYRNSTGYKEKTENPKNEAAVALGRLGGKRGGPARAQKLTKKQRVSIAKKAAKARWSKRST